MGGSYLISAPFLWVSMELKIYTNHCLTCSENQRVETINWFAKKYGVTVTMKRVYVLPELRVEADYFDVPMPFLELNGKTYDFYQVSEYMLKDDSLEEYINEGIKNETKN